MSLAATIQAAINLGYAQTANILGTPFSHYRPLATRAIAQSTLLNTLNASFAQNGNYLKAGKLGNDEWYGYYDPTTVKPGDYLSDGTRTYFIASQEALLPNVAVFCERVISLLGVSMPTGVGSGSYGGDVATNETPLLTAWPCSILQGSSGERGDVTLPEDTRSPWWTVRLPATPGLVIQNGMILNDDLSRRYSISSAELTDGGWRIQARENGT